MRILGIDPGTTSSGYVIWDGESVLEAAEVHNLRMRSVVAKAAAEGGCDQLAIEVMVNIHTAAGKEVIQTILWSGRMIELWNLLGKTAGKTPAVEVNRTAAAQYICADRGVGDKEVAVALRKRFGPLTLSGHCLSALAIAVYHYDHLTKTGKGKDFELTPKPSKRKSKPKPAAKKFKPKPKK